MLTVDSPNEMGRLQEPRLRRVRHENTSRHLSATGIAILTPRCSAQIEPGWHAWISYLVDKPPTQDALLQYKRRAWEDADPRSIPNYTLSRGAYKPYNT